MVNKKISQMDPVTNVEELDNLYFNVSFISKREIIRDIRRTLSLANINLQTNSFYTLGTQDDGSIIERNNASSNILYIPSDDEANIRYQSTITIVQTGTGNTNILANTGVNLRIPISYLPLTAEIYSMLFLYKRGANDWLLNGSLASNGITVEGTVSSILPFITQSSSGNVSPIGSADSTLPFIIQSAMGTVPVGFWDLQGGGFWELQQYQGSIIQSLPSITQNAIATSNSYSEVIQLIDGGVLELLDSNFVDLI